MADNTNSESTNTTTNTDASGLNNSNAAKQEENTNNNSSSSSANNNTGQGASDLAAVTSKYEQQLKDKDAEIQRLSDSWVADKNSHHLTKADIKRSQEALAEAVRERSEIEKEAKIKLDETQSKLETASQATQTLSTEKNELAEKYEASSAKATKYEILANEFPELLRYAKLIPESNDPEAVRASCTALADARKQDLEAQRINAVTNNGVTTLGSGAGRVETQFTDPDKMSDYLHGAGKDVKEYEKRRQVLIDQFNASKAQRSATA